MSRHSDLPVCNPCGTFFKNVTKLQTHWLTSPPHNPLQICPYPTCKAAGFKTSAALLKHISHCDKYDPDVLTCDHCIVYLRDESHRQQHVGSPEHMKMDRRCKTCVLDFDTMMDRRKHTLRKLCYPPDTDTCPRCNERFYVTVLPAHVESCRSPRAKEIKKEKQLEINQEKKQRWQEYQAEKALRYPPRKPPGEREWRDFTMPRKGTRWKPPPRKGAQQFAPGHLGPSQHPSQTKQPFWRPELSQHPPIDEKSAQSQGPPQKSLKEPQYAHQPRPRYQSPKGTQSVQPQEPSRLFPKGPNSSRKPAAPQKSSKAAQSPKKQGSSQDAPKRLPSFRQQDSPKRYPKTAKPAGKQGPRKPPPHRRAQELVTPLKKPTNPFVATIEDEVEDETVTKYEGAEILVGNEAEVTATKIRTVEVPLIELDSNPFTPIAPSSSIRSTCFDDLDSLLTSLGLSSNSSVFGSEPSPIDTAAYKEDTTTNTKQFSTSEDEIWNAMWRNLENELRIYDEELKVGNLL